MTGNQALDLFESGRIDEALDVLGEMDLQGSAWEGFFEVSRNVFLWYRDGDPSYIEKAHAANQPGLDHPEPQYRDWSRDNEVGIAWISERFDDMRTQIRQIEDLLPYLNIWHLGLMAAIRAGHPEMAREVMDLIPTGVGRRFELLREMGDAALELLEGDRDRAAERFTGIAERLEEVETERFAMEWRAVFAEAMPEQPEAQDAARRAHAWFTEAGAAGPLSLFAGSWNAIPARSCAAVCRRNSHEPPSFHIAPRGRERDRLHQDGPNGGCHTLFRPRAGARGDGDVHDCGRACDRGRARDDPGLSSVGACPGSMSAITFDVDIKRFEPTVDGTVVLDAAWTVTTNGHVQHGSSVLSEPIGGAGPDAQVAAMSRLVELLSGELAAAATP